LLEVFFQFFSNLIEVTAKIHREFIATCFITGQSVERIDGGKAPKAKP